MAVGRRVCSEPTRRLNALPPIPQAAAEGTTTAIIVNATIADPTGIGSSVGRNVVIAPRAKIHAFGFRAWNAAASARLSGFATARCSTLPERATRYARYRR